MICGKIVAFDLETTGFSPTKNQILEVGAVAYFPKTGQIETFSKLVNVKGIPGHITKLTGISSKTLIEEGAFPIAQVLEEFRGFILKDGPLNALLVGHNVKKFDIKFLESQKGAFWRRLTNAFHIWDTMERQKALNSKRRPKNQSVSLPNVLKHYRLEGLEVSHRALPDAKACLGIFNKQHRLDRNQITLPKNKVEKN